MDDPNPIQQLASKLDVLINLSALGLVAQIAAAGGKQQDQAKALSLAGVPNVQIASLLRTSPAAVRATLSKIRKKPRGKPHKKAIGRRHD